MFFWAEGLSTPTLGGILMPGKRGGKSLLADLIFFNYQPWSRGPMWKKTKKSKSWELNITLDVWFSKIFHFHTPKMGEDEPNLTGIAYNLKWVG